MSNSVKNKLSEETSQWHSITGNFEAHRYPNTPLLDTNVELDIPTFSIAWEKRFELMTELAELIKKYQI